MEDYYSYHYTASICAIFIREFFLTGASRWTLYPSCCFFFASLICNDNVKVILYLIIECTKINQEENSS